MQILVIHSANQSHCLLLFYFFSFKFGSQKYLQSHAIYIHKRLHSLRLKTTVMAFFRQGGFYPRPVLLVDLFISQIYIPPYLRGLRHHP